MKSLATAFLLAAVASSALADEVVLRNGHKVVGIQKEENDRIIVETGYGTVSFPREEVVSVTKGDTAMHAWPIRYAEIEKSQDAADFTKLAAWARENRMPRYVDGLMKRALELDPNNAQAREALGFVQHKGAWVTRAELRKEQGLVQEGGRWVTPLEKALSERRRLEAESRKIDRDVERRRREEQRRRDREEAQMQASIRAAEMAPTAYEHPGFWGWGSPYGYGYWGDGLYDVIVADWLIALRINGGLPPISSPIPGMAQAWPGSKLSGPPAFGP
jgi:hypothetical protein